MTHFEIFGLSPSVDVDVPALEAKFRALSLEHHPDRQADPKLRRAAADTTATLNQALKVLRDPVQRAFYLLKLKGVDLDAADHRQMPMEFLEEVMERREALEAVKAAKDLPKAQAMAAEVEGLKDNALEAARAALKADDVAGATHQLGRVRYFTRFVEEVEAMEEELLQ